MACCNAMVSNVAITRRTNGTKICMECDQAVYPLELVSTGQFAYHKWCFKCAQCNRTLSTSNYAVAPSGIPYCKPHYAAARNLKGGFEAFAVSYVTSSSSSSIQDLSNRAGQESESTIVRILTTPHVPQPVNRTPVMIETETHGSSGSINSISSGSGDNEDDGPSNGSRRHSNVSRMKAMFEMHQ